MDFEEMATDNPNEFWRKVKHLGPRMDKSIPVEIVDDDGNISRDENVVLTKWKTDFQNLFNKN